MPAVQRMTDANDGGGVLTSTPQAFVRVANLLVAVDGAKGTTHGSGDDEHAVGTWQTAHGAARVRIGGAAVNRKNDVDTCGHIRVDGAPFCRIGNASGGAGGGGDPANEWDTGEWGVAEWQ
jgi:hypothetical protein